jgi:hypothetical protein
VGVIFEIVGVTTVRFTLFDHTPPCSSCAVPDFAPDATDATTCVSLQLTTVPYVLPSHTLPLPCVAPKPDPAIVTCVPAVAVVGVTLLMVGVTTVKFNAFDHTPPCSTCAVPDLAPETTVATTCASDQLTTVPYVLPSHTFPLPCAAPNPDPAIVTCVPAVAVVGVTLLIFGVSTVKFTAFDHTPPCSTCAVPDLAPDATVATICVSLQLTTVP